MPGSLVPIATARSPRAVARSATTRLSLLPTALRTRAFRRQLEEGIEFHRRRYRSAERYLAYFQSFSNTYAPLERLREVFSQAFELPEVAGIVVGTRPDCIDGPKLDYFARLAETRYVAIEYGIESCYDATLRSVNRGHDFACARRAVEMTSERGIRTAPISFWVCPARRPP